MKASNYQKSQKLVERYLELNNRISKGWTSEDISKLHNLCYDCTLLLSEMNCDYSAAKARRTKAAHERFRKQLFNQNVK